MQLSKRRKEGLGLVFFLQQLMFVISSEFFFFLHLLKLMIGGRDGKHASVRIHLFFL